MTTWAMTRLAALLRRCRPSFVAAAGGAAVAQTPDCPGGMRKINVGVSVSPPNVVHTTPYVAKALGYFAKHCIDATIVQFDGGAAGTMATAVAQGTAIGNLTAAAIAQGDPRRADLGLRCRAPPQDYVVAGDIKTARRPQGQAAERRRRRRRLQLADGPRSAQARRPHRRGRAIHRARHGRPASRACSPASSTASSCIPRTSISRSRRNRACMFSFPSPSSCRSCSSTLMASTSDWIAKDRPLIA